MRIKVFVLNIDNYFPELLKYTIPTIRSFANNMGADFEILTERVLTRNNPKLPVTYEKLQVYDRFDQENLDYAIIMDADLLINPALPNPLSMMRQDEVGVWMEYDHQGLFEQALPYPDHQWRSKALVTNYLVVPKGKKEILRPLGPGVLDEMLSFCKRPFIFDEFTVTYRLSQVHMRTTEVVQIVPDNSKIWHANKTSGNKPMDELVQEARKIYENFTSPHNVKLAQHLPTYLNLKDKTKAGVLLGTWNGEFAHLLLSSWGGELFAVDSWRMDNPLTSMSAMLSAMSVFDQYRDRSTFIRRDFAQASKLFADGSLDFVFCAEPPTEELLDLWGTKLNPGGVLAGVATQEHFMLIASFAGRLGQMTYRGNENFWMVELP